MFRFESYFSWKKTSRTPIRFEIVTLYIQLRDSCRMHSRISWDERTSVVSYTLKKDLHYRSFSPPPQQRRFCSSTSPKNLLRTIYFKYLLRFVAHDQRRPVRSLDTSERTRGRDFPGSENRLTRRNRSSFPHAVTFVTDLVDEETFSNASDLEEYPEFRTDCFSRLTMIFTRQ